MYKKLQKMLVGLTVAVVVSLCLTNVSHGQANAGGGMGYFMFGGSILDLGALNTRLAGRGFSQIPSNFTSFGGGGHGLINRVIIGGEGHSLRGRDVTSIDYKTSISAGYGFFNLGYIVLSTEQLRVYPLIGLGGGGMLLTIKDREIPITFNEVLGDPGRVSELSTGGFLLNLSIGTDYLLNLGGDENGTGGLIIGLRAGYVFTPIRGEWTIDGVAIPGGPDIGITGPYIRLVIGFGGIGRQ